MRKPEHGEYVVCPGDEMQHKFRSARVFDTGSNAILPRHKHDGQPCPWSHFPIVLQTTTRLHLDE